MGYEDIISTLAATLRLTTPLLLACLAGLYSERSGIFDIGLEGKMLAAAFGAASISAITGNVWLALLAGILVSIGMAMLHGIASITLKGNQIISGGSIRAAVRRRRRRVAALPPLSGPVPTPRTTFRSLGRSIRY
jgi:ABC-type uncharacterized transport system permease subunit